MYLSILVWLSWADEKGEIKKMRLRPKVGIVCQVLLVSSEFIIIADFNCDATFVESSLKVNLIRVKSSCLTLMAVVEDVLI